MSLRYYHNRQPRPGFTLIEILIVLAVVSILMAGLGVTISNMLTSAKEAQTVATLRKIDGLITERQQGLERAFDSLDFRRFVADQREIFEAGDPANGVPQLFGLSAPSVEAASRKNFFRDFFPQTFQEMRDSIDGSGAFVSDGIPDRIQTDAVYSPLTWTATPTGPEWDGYRGTTVPFTDTNGNGTYEAGTDTIDHDPLTESSELLYFAITRLEIFGAPLIGIDEFRTQEVADTDNDGLPEFIDGWGRPLRFYRWPTRLFKPFGLLGADGAAGTTGVDDEIDTTTDVDTVDVTVNGSNITIPDPDEIGWPGTDDVVIPTQERFVAGLYIEGLPRPPIMVLSGGVVRPVAGDYDMLNEDPDDSYGVLLEEIRRQTATKSGMLLNVSETRFHTLDTYHKPLVVSAGPDGVLGLYEPFYNEDINFNGLFDAATDDGNGNGTLDLGLLAQPVSITSPDAAYDDITNRNRRAGG